ncbi:CIC11C00000001253 [Sungouiella intermedia]|uniref:CIC11C00000001253 n=1 Tax=Sungouiella intermedia TaxID=45354 RepID=A0A1L0DDB4_9ASCO|nr:CIC11C00000001253 [[Candida] intermedia]
MAHVSSTIFHDIVETSRLGQDRELMALLQHHTSNDSPLYNEVQSLIAGLNLQEFDSFSFANHEKDTSAGSGVPRKQLADNYPHDMKISTHEVPKLTKTQRRMSFDLMQMHNGTLRSPRVLLSKPPEAAVTNVNIVTKVTDLESHGYTPLQTEKKNTLKDKFSSYHNRFKLVNRTKKDPPGQIAQATKKSASSGVFKRLQANVASESSAETSQTHSVWNSSSPRRISLVGENLPPYIKKQLGHKNEGDGATNHPTEDHNVPKNQMHVNNLSDVAGLGSTSRSATHEHRGPEASSHSESVPIKNNDSEITDNSFGHTNNESAISEADKEYILPSLFNRFLDYGEHDSLESESHGSASEDQEDEEDDEDDYLFNSHAF